MTTMAAPGVPTHLEMLEGLTACAYELAKAAAEIARRAGDDTRLFFAASTEFRHCSFSVRMGIRLSLQLRDGRVFAAPRSQAADERERPETAEPAEREPSEAALRAEQDRERDREYEPVSLPQFLKSLGLAAAAAERRADELPPEVRDITLPRLKSLLAQARADAAPAAEAPAGLAGPRRSPPTAGPAAGQVAAPGQRVFAPAAAPTARLRLTPPGRPAAPFFQTAEDAENAEPGCAMGWRARAQARFCVFCVFCCC